MSSIEKLTALKEKVEGLRREADKATGALDQAMKQLKESFNCKTLKEGQILLEELEEKEIKAKEKFDKAMNKFEKDWEEVSR